MLPQIVPFNFGETQINLDDTISVACISNKGNLPLEIYWTFIGEDSLERKLSTNDGVVISRAGDRMSWLTIESVKRRHSGSYKCVIKNTAGQANYTSVLAIKGDNLMIF